MDFLYMNDMAKRAEDNIGSNTNATQSPVTLQLLEQGCRQLGIPLTPMQLEQFASYYRELVLWNARFNLTGITDLQEVQTKHFLDSLISLPLIAEELGRDLPLTHPSLCLDVGSGAGLPGIPLKLISPQLHWTLLDGTGKKVTFLRHIVEQLSLQAVNVVQGRAEELGRSQQHRAHYDLVTARAVAPLNILVEYLLPLVKQQGIAMIYKGSSAPEEFMTARKAIQILGGDTIRMAPVQVPFLNEQRFILLIQKVRSTPNLYPRGQGLARKKPLG